MVGRWPTEVTSWTWVAASRRGTSHERRGERRQDAFRTLGTASGDAVVLVACDGAGSAARGGSGAAIAARMLSNALRRRLDSGMWPTDENVWDGIDEVRDRIAVVAERIGMTSRDFATTVVLVISDGTRTMAVHVGDGAAVVRCRETEVWTALSWPTQGEYASTTFFLTDEGGARVRISRSDVPVDRLAVFTDGIERLALDFASHTAHAPFFSGISEPVARAPTDGWNVPLSRKLGEYLSCDAVNARTDDDKTLILACRR